MGQYGRIAFALAITFALCAIGLAGCRAHAVDIQTSEFSRTRGCLSPSVVIDALGKHYMYAVGSAATGSLEVIVMEGNLGGTIYDEPQAVLPKEGEHINGPEELPPVIPWHVAAKRDLETPGITLLINGHAYDTKTRVRNLYLEP